MKRVFFAYPIFFSAFPILAFYTANIEKVRPFRIFTPLELSIASTVGIWLIVYAIIKDKFRASLLVTFYILIFFSYGHFYNLLDSVFNLNVESENNIPLFLTWSAIGIYGGFLILKIKNNLETLTRAMFFIGLILVFMQIIQVLYIFPAQQNFINKLVFSEENTFTEAFNNKIPQGSYPDIYYIVLDGYAGNEVLSALFGFENSEFTNFLTDKGFRIPSNVRSNYALTSLSLASSLNMNYINYLSEITRDSSNTIVASEMIKNNEVLRMLKPFGYKSVHFSSGWRATDRNRFADLNIYCGRNNDFNTVLTMTTMLRPFENIYLQKSMRERILCTFERLANIKNEINGPLFVFAHIVSPHPPYIFGKSGEFINDPRLSKANDFSAWQNREAYLNQLKFINKKTEELTKKLLSNGDKLPIIIIQADHGPASTPGMEDYNNSAINERMRPFFAYYIPGDKDFFPQTVTPVNIFRGVLNECCNLGLERLEDKVYFSTYAKPYIFSDVTKLVEGSMSAWIKSTP